MNTINPQLQYRVVKVERYIVTRYTNSQDGKSGSVEGRGEYDNADVAHEVAYALCKREHDMLGWPPGDDRIRYPVRAGEAIAA